MPMKPLVIYGVGQLSELVTFYVQNDSSHKVVGYVTESPSATGHLGLPLSDLKDLELTYSQSETDLFVAISYHEQNKIRARICNSLRERGWNLASIVSRSAHVASNAAIGDNTLVLEGAVIQPWSRIGDGTVIWSGVQIGHHSLIGRYVFLSAGVVLMGCNEIGDYCHLAGGVTVKDHVTVGSGAQIGPGSTVLETVFE